MEFGSMSSILSELSLEEERRQQTLLASAQVEADVVYNEIIEDGKKRINQRRYRLKQELATKKRQEMTRISMNAQQEINLFKQEKIEIEIECCKNHFKQLSEERFLKILENAMSNVSPKDNPKILVPERYYVATANIYQKICDVVVEEAMVAGFIITCDTFDINYDMAQVFAYKDQELRRALMTALFEDESINIEASADMSAGD